MRNFEITFPRLMVIYEHFAEGKLYRDYSWYPDFFVLTDKPVTVYSDKRAYYDAFPFVYGELPDIYSEGEYWAYGKIRCKLCPHLDEDEGLKWFLGLTTREFNHLFIPTMQDQRLGGEELSFRATPQQVAGNIAIFLEKQLHWWESIYERSRRWTRLKYPASGL